jgi:hypothetical protein
VGRFFETRRIRAALKTITTEACEADVPAAAVGDSDVEYLAWRYRPYGDER